MDEGATPRADVALPDDVPHWLQEAVDSPFFRKARDTIGTLVGFVVSPRAAAARWASGQMPRTNPLFLMAASAAVLAPIRQELERFRGVGRTSSFLETAFEALAPYTYYAALGLIAHAVLRVFGPLRPLRASLGVGLLTGASAGTLVTLLTLASSFFLYRAHGTVNFLDEKVPHALSLVGVVFLLLLYAFLLAALTLGLSGAHRVPRWRAAIAVVVAIVLAGRIIDVVPFGLGIAHVWWTNKGFHIAGFGFRF